MIFSLYNIFIAIVFSLILAGPVLAAVRTNPLIPLTQYQREWIEDKSRFKIGMWSRQSGKTFGTTLEIALDMAAKGSTWVCLSRGERQSRELMSQLKVHLRAINIAVDILETTFRDENGNETVYKQLEVVLPNGARAIGLPANPDTARGWSANVYLDEFAIHKDSRSIWTALFPTITRGYRIIITSTPLGKKNKFYEIWTSDGETWSTHQIDIHSAVEKGLVLKDQNGKTTTPDDLRVALGDDEAWAQEYLLEFMDEATAWLPFDLIGSVENEQAIRVAPWAVKLVDAAQEAYEIYRQQKIDIGSLAHLVEIETDNDLYAGMDIGRKRDLSVIWLDEDRDGISWALAVIDMHKRPFFVQEKVLHAILAHPKMRRACIDATGIGAQLAETAQLEFGQMKVEPVMFTNPHKEALAVGIKNRFEDALTRIPIDDTIRRSLHAVKKMTTATGANRFDAERSEQHGHADHFWAKALSEEARDKSSVMAADGEYDPEDGEYHADIEQDTDGRFLQRQRANVEAC